MNPIRESDRPMLLAIFQQSWENVRHIKNERMMFTNIYAIITAGVLSLLNTVRGHWNLETLLIGFLLFLSVIGLLSSLRLKAELDECLINIERLLESVDLEEFMAMGKGARGQMRLPKFRWLFPLFYSFTTLTCFCLLISKLFQWPWL
jgi:hypothetical protein